MNVENNGQPINDDEVKLTAYALGEVKDPQEIRHIENLLDSDSQLRSDFESISKLGSLIRESVDVDLPMAPGSLHDLVSARLDGDAADFGESSGGIADEALLAKLNGPVEKNESQKLADRRPASGRSWWRENRQVLMASISLSLLVGCSLLIWRPWEPYGQGSPTDLARAESQAANAPSGEDESRAIESRANTIELDDQRVDDFKSVEVHDSAKKVAGDAANQVGQLKQSVGESSVRAVELQNEKGDPYFYKQLAESKNGIGADAKKGVGFKGAGSKGMLAPRLSIDSVQDSKGQKNSGNKSRSFEMKRGASGASNSIPGNSPRRMNQTPRFNDSGDSDSSKGGSAARRFGMPENAPTSPQSGAGAAPGKMSSSKLNELTRGGNGKSGSARSGSRNKSPRQNGFPNRGAARGGAGGGFGADSKKDIDLSSGIQGGGGLGGGGLGGGLGNGGFGNGQGPAGRSGLPIRMSEKQKAEKFLPPTNSSKSKTAKPEPTNKPARNQQVDPKVRNGVNPESKSPGGHAGRSVGGRSVGGQTYGGDGSLGGTKIEMNKFESGSSAGGGTSRGRAPEKTRDRDGTVENAPAESRGSGGVKAFAGKQPVDVPEIDGKKAEGKKTDRTVGKKTESRDSATMKLDSKKKARPSEESNSDPKSAERRSKTEQDQSIPSPSASPNDSRFEREKSLSKRRGDDPKKLADKTVPERIESELKKRNKPDDESVKKYTEPKPSPDRDRNEKEALKKNVQNEKEFNGNAVDGLEDRQTDEMSALDAADDLASEGMNQLNESLQPSFENDFIQPLGTNAISTFSIDTDTASYGNVRQMVQRGVRPHPDQVRIEEFLNYFSYDYSKPKPGKRFSVDLELGAAPWTPGNKLLRVGLMATEIPNEDRPPSNLVFLIDVSGSMRAQNKLPLLQKGISAMVDQLREDDYVSVVTYSTNIQVPLKPTDGSQKAKIKKVVNSLKASGSTNGSGGLEEAYKLATENFLRGGTNRIVMGTDGDFNVGIQKDDELVRFIKEKADESKVFLTICGFGVDNFKDQKVQKMAQNGNGKVYFVDSDAAAKKVFVEGISGGLVNIAKDVKVQLLFNPRMVQSYRLIGYETRMLELDDFANDLVDAGEVGAGDRVTALYEIVPADKDFAFPTVAGGKPIDLKYQIFEERKFTLTDEAKKTDIAALRVRFKEPEGDKSVMEEFVVKNDAVNFNRSSKDLQFASSVAAWGMLLRGSRHRGTLNYDGLIEMTQGAIADSKDEDRHQFLSLVKSAKRLYVRPRPARPVAPADADSSQPGDGIEGADSPAPVDKLKAENLKLDSTPGADRPTDTNGAKTKKAKTTREKGPIEPRAESPALETPVAPKVLPQKSVAPKASNVK